MATMMRKCVLSVLLILITDIKTLDATPQLGSQSYQSSLLGYNNCQDVDVLLGGYCRTDNCRRVIANLCYIESNSNQVPNCSEVEACIQNHINYYRTTGRFDPANKAGPAVKPLAVTFIGTVLALLLAA